MKIHIRGLGTDESEGKWDYEVTMRNWKGEIMLLAGGRRAIELVSGGIQLVERVGQSFREQSLFNNGE